MLSSVNINILNSIILENQLFLLRVLHYVHVHRRRWNRSQRLGWRSRKYYVHSDNDRRLSIGGEYENLFCDRKNAGDNKRFQKYIRLSIQQFHEVLALVRPHIEPHWRRRAISAEMRLVVTLKFLKSGLSYDDLSERFRIGNSTVHNIIKETLKILVNVLQPVYVPLPSTEDYYEIMEGFLYNCTLMNCVGAIDGKHINIQAPSHLGSLYYNYKGCFSVVLMAVVDSMYCFRLVDVGQYGSISDGGVFA